MKEISTTVIEQVASALRQLPPPPPAVRCYRAEQAVTELYDDLRAAVLAGHSLPQLVEAVLKPVGWAISAEKLRRHLVNQARDKKDSELATLVGGLRPRRRRRQPSKPTEPTKKSAKNCVKSPPPLPKSCDGPTTLPLNLE